MAHRIGVCGSCRARFQIPATFTHKHARCRNCGGVVDIGPEEGAPRSAAEPELARAPAPSPRTKPAPGPAPQPAPGPAAPRPAAFVPTARPTTPVASAPSREPASSELARAEPGRRRSALIPALVAALVLAVLALGAWSVFGARKSAPVQSPPKADADPGGAPAPR